MFDADDIDAAFEELDARYLAGEAASHADTWSLITETFAGFNRGEITAPPQGWNNVDHRHSAAMAPGEGVAYLHASWELAASLNVYIEAVHQLTDIGAVFTHRGSGTSKEGFEAEWRTIDIITVDDDRINQSELFDEADLDKALARFEELSKPAGRLENPASRVVERYLAHFMTRDWDAMSQMLADDSSVDDRRRTVNSGISRGRDVGLEQWRAAAAVGFTDASVDVVATRGERLSLTRAYVSKRDERTAAFNTEALHVVERFKKLPNGNLQYDVTVEDPNVWVRPWVIPARTFPLRPETEYVSEFVCDAPVVDYQKLFGKDKD
jgi:ketosteroid isomerase-like protein